MTSAGPALLAAIAEQLPDAVIFADREGLIRHWNPGAQAVFGFTADEVLGQSLDVIIPERLRAPHWAAYRRAIESGHTRGGNAVRTTRALHKNGRKLYVDFSFGLVLDRVPPQSRCDPPRIQLRNVAIHARGSDRAEQVAIGLGRCQEPRQEHQDGG